MKKVFEIPLYPYTCHEDQSADAPARKKVVVIGAGPVGLAAAIDLAQQGIEVVILDDNDKVSFGSRAICFAKRPLEILDRLGCGDRSVEKGVTWNKGKVFFDEREVYGFDLLPDPNHKRPAFINLQQYYIEEHLVRRCDELKADGKPIEIRGKNKVVSVTEETDFVAIEVETPDGNYNLHCDWVIACDGASSPTRSMMGLDFHGRVFEDNFLIADVVMDAEFPTERWFWFDPPFNKGHSALLHKQPDNVWRIDLQLGWDINREKEMDPERVRKRLRKMLGEKVNFELEWVSIYTFQCRRMEKFRHGRVIFAGDAAHQVSPFGARGANSGFADTDNLIWKLKLVIDGLAPPDLLDSYEEERIMAADENILNSTRSTDFITPKTPISRLFRNAVLDLSEKVPFARPLVNSGRLSVPTIYDACSLNGADDSRMPHLTRPGAPATDAPQGDGWLLDGIGNVFQLLVINATAPNQLEVDGITITAVNVSHNPDIKSRYLGETEAAVYLIRPDQHVVARWTAFDEALISAAVRNVIASGKRGVSV